MESSKKVFDADFGDVIEAHAEGFKDGHREGVIEGLAQAQGIAIARVILKQPERIEDDIKLLIERLRAEQKGTVPLCRVCQQPQDYIHGDTCSRCAPSGPPQTVQKEG